MRTGLAVSTVAHAGLILLAIVGLGFSQPMDPAAEESIAVDLVPADAFSNIRLGSEKSDIVDTETPSALKADKPAELAQPTGNTEQDQPTPQQSDTPSPKPTTQTAPAPQPAEPVVQPEPQPPAEPLPETADAQKPAPADETAPAPVMPAPPLATPEETPDPADAAPVPVIKTASLADKRAAYQKQLQAEQQQAEDAKKQAAQQAAAKQQATPQKVDVATREDTTAKPADDISDIINSEKSRGATTGEGGQPTLGKDDGRSARLTQSETASLIAQMRSCWNLLPDEIQSGLTARLLVSLNPDGTVSGRPQVIEKDNSPMGIRIANDAVAAVLRCGPYKLAADKYSAWQQVDVTFRPSDL